MAPIVVIVYLMMALKVKSKRLLIGESFQYVLTIPTFVVVLIVGSLQTIKITQQ